MQKTAVVLMHLFHRLGLSNEVLFVDTGYHFFETLKMRDEYMRRYRLNVVTLYPASTIEEQETLHGGKLFATHRRSTRMLPDAKGGAVARSPGDEARAGPGQRSAPRGGREARTHQALQPKIAAPAATSCRRSTIGPATTSRAYIAEHNLLVHPLHAAGYPSIGCYPCTTPVAPGEDARAGRWRHLRVLDADAAPEYCSINFTDGGGI